MHARGAGTPNQGTEVQCNCQTYHYRGGPLSGPLDWFVLCADATPDVQVSASSASPKELVPPAFVLVCSPIWADGGNASLQAHDGTSV